MRALSRAKVSFLTTFVLLFLVAAELTDRLPAQDDSASPPAVPSDSGAPMQAPGNAAPDQVAPDQAPAPSADQSQDFTSDDPTGATQGDASFQTFYDALANQGTWIQSNDYGYVWQPQVTDSNWAPYTQGHWAYSDDGWTWVSDESFGWATYHYGRWVNLEGYGWVWVPGYTWAPAWVSWRYGDGYAGWAPLPPDSFVGVDYSDDNTSTDFGYHIGGDADSYYGIGAAYYVFLPVNCLGYRNYHGYYCNRNDNWRYIGHTRNVTNINVNNHQGLGTVTENGGAPGRTHRVFSGGPKLAQVNAVSQTPIQKVTLTHSTERGGGTLNGNTLALYAPHVSAHGNGVVPKPASVSGWIGQGAKVNHGTDISKPIAVNSRLSPQPPTPAQVEQARIAQSQTSPEARAVLDDSTIKPVLQRPLTAMRPSASATRSVTPSRTTSSATYQTPSITAPSSSTAPASTYTPTRVYPQAGGGEAAPSPTSIPPTRVYPTQSFHEVPQEQQMVPPSRTYAPAPVYPSNPAYQPRSTPVEPSGRAAGESPTYVRPMAPPAPAQEFHPSTTPAPSSGGGNFHAAPSSSAPASSSSAGAASGGTSANSKSH